MGRSFNLEAESSLRNLVCEDIESLAIASAIFGRFLWGRYFRRRQWYGAAHPRRSHTHASLPRKLAKEAKKKGMGRERESFSSLARSRIRNFYDDTFAFMSRVNLANFMTLHTRHLTLPLCLPTDICRYWMARHRRLRFFTQRRKLDLTFLTSLFFSLRILKSSTLVCAGYKFIIWSKKSFIRKHT